MLRMIRKSDDGQTITYSFGGPNEPQRTLVYNRVDQRIWPADNKRDGTFRAAATQLARILSEHDDAPDHIIYQA